MTTHSLKILCETEISIQWFRRDLRIKDNPAYYYAQLRHKYVLPIYIDDSSCSDYSALGRYGKWWLYKSLGSLKIDLNDGLRIFQGREPNIILDLCLKYQIKDVYCNKMYDKYSDHLELEITTLLQQYGITLHIFDDELIPLADLRKYHVSQVFTYFYKKVTSLNLFNKPLSYTLKNNIFQSDETHLDIDYISDQEHLSAYWQPSEQQANLALDMFHISDLRNYEEYRNHPYQEVTSQLSPFIAFGNISLRTCYDKTISKPNSASFIRQLLWGEFCRYMLHLYPNMMYDNINVKMNEKVTAQLQFNETHFDAWKDGRTGYAFIDAGMRQLKECGYMHNRLRMITASFLVKNMLIPWQYGERWFWQHLLDANFANNSFGWQWVAGTSGPSTSPLYTVFNPTTQLVKYDQYLTYTTTFLPEVIDMSLDKLCQTPYLTPPVDFDLSRKKWLNLIKRTPN